MAHHIHPGQLDGEHTHVLASSSSEDNKRLVYTLSIKTNRFHIEEFMHYHVYHNGSIVHSSNRLQLAVKVYNKIDESKPMKYPIKTTTDFTGPVNVTKSICLKCDHQDHCNRYLRNPEHSVVVCASFKDLV